RASVLSSYARQGDRDRSFRRDNGAGQGTAAIHAGPAARLPRPTTGKGRTRQTGQDPPLTMDGRHMDRHRTRELASGRTADGCSTAGFRTWAARGPWDRWTQA